jgi:hypothetical protein
MAADIVIINEVANCDIQELLHRCELRLTIESNGCKWEIAEHIFNNDNLNSFVVLATLEKINCF